MSDQPIHGVLLRIRALDTDQLLPLIPTIPIRVHDEHGAVQAPSPRWLGAVVRRFREIRSWTGSEGEDVEAAAFAAVFGIAVDGFGEG